MSDPSNMSMDQDIPTNALRIYNQDDTAEDFPVLKAFQQYIDAEQAKARKRMLTMGIFFGAFTFVIIAIFVALLIHVTMRNQTLNDRMLDLAMRDRDNRGSAVVVQSPTPQQDNSAVLTLTAKLDEMQKQMAENQVKAERAVAEAEAKARQAALEAVKPKPPSPEETEIARLRALLAAEKKNAEEEKERKRQAELEEYRRKHYPELYEQQEPRLSYTPTRRNKPQTSVDDIIKDIDNTLDNLDDDKAISYFDEDEDNEQKQTRSRKKNAKKPVKAEAQPESEQKPEPTKESQKESSIPVDIKGSSTTWRVPAE